MIVRNLLMCAAVTGTLFLSACSQQPESASTTPESDAEQTSTTNADVNPSNEPAASEPTPAEEKPPEEAPKKKHGKRKKH